MCSHVPVPAGPLTRPGSNPAGPSKLARAKRGSNRRARVRLGIARLRAGETDRRKDWAEKASTDLARRFDVIRVEDLKIANMTRSATGSRERPGRNVGAKAGLNRGILRPVNREPQLLLQSA